MIRTTQKLQWQDVALVVRSLNPGLADLIDEIAPDGDHAIYKVKYNYGDKILSRSAFQLPSLSGELTPLKSDKIDKTIRDELGYHQYSNPVCLLLNKTSELYITVDEQIIPYVLLKPGNIMGLWGSALNVGSNAQHHPVFIWDMTAGARSVFMLPKISDLVSHKRLQKETGIKEAVPKHLYQQWHVFKELVDIDVNESNKWQTSLLCFSKKWFEHHGDARWDKLYNLLLKTAWTATEYYRNSSVWNLIYSIIVQQNKINIDTYYSKITKHLFNIGMGISPGFVPALTEDCAPISYLQDIYTNGPYQLKNYIPTILEPALFSHNASSPVYFSPKYLTAMDFTPKINKRVSYINELRAIQQTLNKYKEAILENDLNIKSTPLYKMLEKVKFEFFHFYKDSEVMRDISSVDGLLAEDCRFAWALASVNKNMVPASASFIRNCIRVRAIPTT